MWLGPDISHSAYTILSEALQSLPESLKEPRQRQNLRSYLARVRPPKVQDAKDSAGGERLVWFVSTFVWAAPKTYGRYSRVLLNSSFKEEFDLFIQGPMLLFHERR
jgi:hypothetical protein